MKYIIPNSREELTAEQYIKQLEDNMYALCCEHSRKRADGWDTSIRCLVKRTDKTKYVTQSINKQGRHTELTVEEYIDLLERNMFAVLHQHSRERAVSWDSSCKAEKII